MPRGIRGGRGRGKGITMNITKSNHTIGCELEAIANVLEYRGFQKEADQLNEIAGRLK